MTEQAQTGKRWLVVGDFSWLVRFSTLAGYAIVAAAIVFAWSVRDQNLIRAASGVGYWLGIVGSTLMLLLLLYPLRKRFKSLRRLGSIKYWFRTHMMFGIVGPLLVLLHSNFNLGSFNGRIALFSTLVVAMSGIVGRYLYAKIHNGMYGQRTTFDAIRSDIESNRTGDSALTSLIPVINERLGPIEDTVADAPDGVLRSLSTALVTTLACAIVKPRVRRDVKRHLLDLGRESRVVGRNRRHLTRSSLRYLDYRFSVLRKFAQLRAAERLFSLWHVVHYPLFIVLVIAAVMHVVAVHMY
ncbi:MAG: transcriptional regulator [Gammaproteobacteria bacterium]|nr:transcriptional regulator [Gammaproteobacteria bacterium]